MFDITSFSWCLFDIYEEAGKNARNQNDYDLLNKFLQDSSATREYNEHPGDTLNRLLFDQCTLEFDFASRLNLNDVVHPGAFIQKSQEVQALFRLIDENKIVFVYDCF